MLHSPAILVVEDNAVNRIAMQALLRSLELSCHIVESGMDALAAVHDADYELVLLDLMMPGLDGFDTARAIRAAEFATGRRTPILAVTALDRDAVRGPCVAAGIDDIVCKPVDTEVIAAQLRKWTNIPVVELRGARAGDSDLLGQFEASEEIGKMLAAFLDVTSALLGQLEVAIMKRDDAAVQRAVHELKGASLQVRAKEMARLCFELELASRKDNHGEMVAIYAALAHAFVRIKRFTARSDTAQRARAE